MCPSIHVRERAMETNFFAIHPQVLRINTKLPFDVHIRTAKDKYSRIFGSGTVYTAGLHVKIFKYSLPALHVKSGDIPSYFAYLEKYFDVIFQDMLISVKSKAKIAHELVTNLARRVLQKPEAALTKRYMKVVSLLTNFILNDENAIKHMISFTSTGFSEYNHLVNVGIYGLGLLRETTSRGEKHNFPAIASGFFLHDIGKYDIPKHVLQKNGDLTDEEWALVKKHPETGYKLMKSMNLLSEEIGVIILQHHERHNGSGYPRGLKGDQIHRYSKICSIADIFDALTANRPYREAKSSFEALKTMQNEMKDEFDPKLFAGFVMMFRKHG